MIRARLRDLGWSIGRLATGTYNAITDVPGVSVGHCTLIHDIPRVARTGVTIILPREEAVWNNHAFAGFHALNGNGEFTGIHWLNESGLLTTPIALTNTHQVGLVRDTLVAYEMKQTGGADGTLPLVAETYDGWLNDINAFHLTQEHVLQALADAKGGPVGEGCVGAGTGTICHEFKGGIGTSSRLANTGIDQFTVGVLVQVNHGERIDLRVDGVPVGYELDFDTVPSPWVEPPKGSSVIVILATDAPLLPDQCRGLAARSTIGLARAGCMAHNGSGDLFLAFATGNSIPAETGKLIPLNGLPQSEMNQMFEAAAEAVEEAVINALTMAETTRGYQGHTAHALPLDALAQVMRKYGR